MEPQVDEVTREAPEEEAVRKPQYDLHIMVPEEMRTVLKDAAELAYRMGSIPKPDLVNLMNLFIGWGMTVLKQKWLEKSGYR